MPRPGVYALVCLFWLLWAPGVWAQAPLQTLEYQLFNLLNRHRRSQNLPTLQYDARASTVARTHSETMQQDNFFSLSSPARGSLEYQLAYARVSGRQQHAFIALDYDPTRLFEQLKRHQALLSEDITHAAVGLSRGEHPKHGEILWATIILLEYLAELDELPRTVQPGETLRFKASVSLGYRNPRLPVTLPSGKVRTFYPRHIRQGQASFEVPLDQGRGRYTLELLLDHPEAGPRVASILPVYVGAAYPLKEPTPQPSAQQFANTDQAARYLLQRLNAERQKHQLKSLKPDELLNYVAYLHSEDMAKRQFFAHINPDGLDPNARYQAQGGKGQVGENIAYDTLVASAHQRLMNSPGHRANMLHQDFTHVGMGVYFNGTHFYITQLFQQKAERVKVQDFKAELLNWLGTQRQRKQLPVLKEEPRFSEAARQHTLAMIREDQLAYRLSQGDFAARYQSQGGRYRELSTLILSARNLEEALERLQKHEQIVQQARWRKMGLGVVQADSETLGPNLIWITLGLASD
ncbi:MAG: CAP domain-containing protein [Candidatus Sericytochromatia bacterium]|nr:CAP domain-containing protein [Candidatus Sericytochromatia bacterium]